ncbi:uncharacterized protein A1O9_10521 [Exophiala aquamarina CBS 119918]|uniref:ferric-chelate reductase (NADPH) n=1 Tax=Exophiala aquamarina CBS 119918 TaxID=1182545 RepID=A0A072P120_9EURO|nr:uncharacterized protein A1O9_10521 [Exophiala aquamarina CBS 119918]KEF53546.1 hypothetical protein A1O9_10521 [Exophiala aquamarina CBS 119918]
MDMSGMSGMSGMDMSSASMFTPTNKLVAHTYWYIVAAVVGVLVAQRAIDQVRVRLLNRKRQTQPESILLRLGNIFAQSYDTLTAICREMTYPQIWTGQGKFSRHLTPPPLGRILLLLTYWVVILTMLWSNTILTPSSPNYAYKWEIIGFRAAWVSVTQLPLIYILSGKGNIITLLTGISYERLNWLHRWVSRTMFLTLIVHWSYFFTEWDIANFVKFEMDMMPMVKYGFGAWAVIGWMVITGFGFIRSLSYELWLLQHLASAMVLLWLVYLHVPSYAQYNVWFAVGSVVFDRLVRGLKMAASNIGFNKSGLNTRLIGYEAEVKCVSSGFIQVIIKHAKFNWKAGQHVYLSIPRIGILEAHPFTIANLSKSGFGAHGSNDLELYIKAHDGFTKRLHRHCQELTTHKSFFSFVSGPWGNPPSIDRFESLILLSTGNGASFTLPIFQQAAMTENSIRQIRFIWIFRNTDQLDWFKERLISTWNFAQSRNVQVSILVFITGTGRDSSLSQSGKTPLLNKHLDSPMRSSHTNMASSALLQAAAGSHESLNKDQTEGLDGLSLSTHWSDSLSAITLGYGRPALDPLILPVVEEAWGETGILACGGAAFTGSIRNYVANLSDERAVHKGTGAQGLYLFCETYCW